MSDEDANADTQQAMLPKLNDLHTCVDQLQS
jgi:hypothetical protein